MKSILFFDDFLIHRESTIERRFHTPVWMDEYAYSDPVSPYGMGYASVVRAPEGGYRLYYICIANRRVDDLYARTLFCVAESDDALSWTPLDSNRKYPGLPSHVLFAGDPVPAGCWVYRDPGESGASRYLTTNSPVVRDAAGWGLIPVPSVVLESSDGLQWREIPESSFLPHHSDTCNALLYNPLKRRYQITLRRRWGERRIFQVESPDLHSWSAPHPVLHPSSIDPPSTHFYGMPSFFCESGGIFVGFLWLQHMPYNDVMGGPVTTEYAYSYDGELWNRTHTVSMPRREPGSFGGGSIYASAMIERERDIVVYAVARLEEHHAIGLMVEQGVRSGTLLAGTLRKNGFVSLVSTRGRGEITTECLLLERPEITLNVVAPLGGVRAQLTGPDYRPIEGCTYDECEEIRGDHLAAAIRWRGSESFRRAVSERRWIRLQISLEHAELYSIDTRFVFTINDRAPIYPDL